MSNGMKRPNREAALRGALEFIAAHPDGCTQAVLAAENIPAANGFVVARQEIVENEDGTTEVTRVWPRQPDNWRWQRTSNRSHADVRRGGRNIGRAHQDPEGRGLSKGMTMTDEIQRKAAGRSSKKKSAPPKALRPCPNTKPKVRPSAPRLRV